MYVVAGVTGHTGGVVAESLLAQGKPVTVIARSKEKGEAWRSKGAETAVARLEDAGRLQKVLAKAEGAYLLVPPVYTAQDLLAEQRKVADTLAKAVAESGISHVVFLSSIAAHHASGTGPIRSLHYAESVLSSAAKNLTILRPPYFLENWAPVLGAAKQNGILPSFLPPERTIPMIATKDIGRLAAESLLNPARGRRVLELAGPEDYSPNDIARALGTLLGREVRVNQAPLEGVVPAFTAAGFSEGAALLFQEMYAGINSGHVAYEGQGTEFRRGTVTPAEVFEGLLRAAQAAKA